MHYTDKWYSIVEYYDEDGIQLTNVTNKILKDYKKIKNEK